MGGGGDVPKGNKPECVILFHNGTSLLRNGKMKSLIHSLSPERMSNTLHFLYHFRIVLLLMYLLFLWRGTGPTPSYAPSNDVAPLKIIMYRATKTTGTLEVLCTQVLLCSVVVCCV
jgi:hypothetical protein